MPNESLISSLLFEAEGAELDFKRDQYPFQGADDRAKSELLKDVLAFANAWRRSDAYILIGVQEVKEAESTVVGITEHIDDARLQQFVNSKTNRPVEFSYTPMQFRGKQLGVIHIPVQDRPTFLVKDFGALRRNTVYLRRGSSTDEARPDEIARMGQATSAGIRPRPILVPQLVTGTDWSEFVTATAFETVVLNQPDIKCLPDYSPEQPTGPFGISIRTSLQYNNSDFYRDRAEYLRIRSKLRPIRFGVRNDGTALASGVKLTMQISDPTHLVELVLRSDLPTPPRREWSPIDNIRPITASLVTPDIQVTRTNAGWTVSAQFGKVQAKDTAVTSEELYVGTTKTDSVDLLVSVFADELSNPVTSVLSLAFTVTEQEISLEKLTG